MAETSAASLAEQLEPLRARIDASLSRYADLGPGCPDRLREAVRYSLLSPGKRLRPLLVLAAARACGDESGAAMPAACAVEMIHAYSLIHDDLPAMDDDDLRRGRPTCHRQFDEATAILAGDALLALALQIVARDIQPAEVARQCTAELAYAAGPENLVGGQADDLAHYTEGGPKLLESIHRRKTGAMLVVSLRLGGLVASASDEQLAALTQYGSNMGLAFQIVDDLLDVGGNEQDLGKRTGKDSDRGKLTFPGVLGVQESRLRAEKLIAEAIASLAPLADRAALLESIARYILKRNH